MVNLKHNPAFRILNQTKFGWAKRYSMKTLVKEIFGKTWMYTCNRVIAVSHWLWVESGLSIIFIYKHLKIGTKNQAFLEKHPRGDK